MAMELEEKVMAAIGLGQHYNWYNGSGSCEYIRKNAANKLAEAMQIEGITPNNTLVGLVRQAAQKLDDSEYTLTNTWQVASDVIQTHIRAETLPVGKERDEFVARMVNSIAKTYGLTVPGTIVGSVTEQLAMKRRRLMGNDEPPRSMGV